MNDFREYSDYLMHYGIPGQRRGLRRYQNEDGTLTPAGRLRYLTNANNHGVMTRNAIATNGNVNRRANNQLIFDSKTGTGIGLSNRGAANFRHDNVVNKAATMLSNIEDDWAHLKRNGLQIGRKTIEVDGTGETQRRKSERINEFEEKILKGEEKAKSILDNMSNSLNNFKKQVKNKAKNTADSIKSFLGIRESITTGRNDPRKR